MDQIKIIQQSKKNSTTQPMNKKPLDSLLQHENFNESLFKQSVSLVQSTKNIVPVSQLPLEITKTKSALQFKKKQQTIETQLSKTIKLFGQVLGVSKNTYGTMTDYATQIFDELTDLIETSCQSYIDKKKNMKAIEKQKQNEKNTEKVSSTPNRNISNRPQDKNPFIKPAYFDHHSHSLPSIESIVFRCERPQHSHPISEPFIYINTREGLQKMIMQLKQSKQIAVDLQHSNKSYEGLTCLIQISSRHKDYIIDVFPIWQFIPMLKEIIQNQKIIKVMHGAEMDTKWLQRDFNIHIINLFDTYKASRVLGYPKFSYAYLLHHYCNTLTDKKYQLADWRERPLSPEMLNYARIDTHYLLQIWDKLIIDLTKQSISMNLDPQSTITQIYKSSHEVSLCQVELFSYKKKQIYQNIKNDTKVEDFEIIQTVFWTIDKVAKEQDEAFDDLINRRTLTDVIARVKDLLQNRRATIDMLRVKIDRLIGVIKSHKHEKISLLLAPLKKQLEKYFLEPKKEAQGLLKKKVKTDKETPLIQLIQKQQKREIAKENIPQSEETFCFQKASVMIEQLDYPLKTYENFTIQQRINNKKNAFSLIQFEPIMSFMSKKFQISEKNPDANESSKGDGQQSREEMQLEQLQNGVNENQEQQKENEGFLEFKRIKPNVIYTLEEQPQQEQNKTQKKPRKKRKELEYEQKLKNKQGNIYELLEDV